MEKNEQKSTKKMTFPDSFHEKQKELHDLKYVSFNRERIHVSELEGKSITPSMRREMRMNSYAQDDLPPKLTDEALIEMAEYHLSQCSKPSFPCTTYEESLVHKILPELIERLKER